jgi:hypothetical protein
MCLQICILHRLAISSFQKLKKWPVISIITLLAFTHCAPMYAPMVHNTPMLSGRSEFQASAATTIGISSGIRGDVQTAYALTNHVGAIANVSASDTNNEGANFSSHSAEFGLGYYNNTQNNWCFELYSGYGFGAGRRHSYQDITDDVRLNKFFIQPSMGMNKGRTLWNFSFKVSHVNLNTTTWSDGSNLTKAHQSAYFLEPMAQWQTPLRNKNIFATFRVGLNLQAANDSEINYEMLSCSGGILFKLKRSKEKNEP